MNILDLHKKIDSLLAATPVDFEAIRQTLTAEPKTKQYLYASAAPTAFVSDFAKHGFFSVLSTKSLTPDQYGFTIPELGYLDRAVAGFPGDVTDVILATTISADTFNPEVIARYIRLSAKLSADSLAKVVRKMHVERWLYLMRKFRGSGFQYEEMFKTLVAAKDWESACLLAEEALTLDDVVESAEPKYFGNDVRFVMSDLVVSGVFHALIALDDSHTEAATALLWERINAMAKLVESRDETFEYAGIYLYKDLFATLVPNLEDKFTHDPDRELVAVFKVLFDRALTMRDSSDKFAYIQRLMSDRVNAEVTWVIWLYALSCTLPESAEILQRELLAAIDGTEQFARTTVPDYRHMLTTSFESLPKNFKQQYIETLLSKARADIAKDTDRVTMYSRHFSSIAKSLIENQELQQSVRELGITLDPAYTPKSRVGHAQVVDVVDKLPEDFTLDTVESTVQKIKTAWSPKQLAENNETASYFERRDASAVGDAIRKAIEEDPNKYIVHAGAFFSSSDIHPYYTQSFLSAFHKAISQANQTHFDALVDMLHTIATENEDHHLTVENSDHGFIGGWGWVDDAMARLLEVLLDAVRKSKDAAWLESRKEKIKVILLYLLSSPSPVKEAETDTEPLTTAINSTRGKAYEAMLRYMYLQDLAYAENAIRIDDDTKRLFVDFISQEKTLALRSLIGRELASLYFRDTTWTMEVVVPLIFKDPNLGLSLSAWVGYLSNQIYTEMFKGLKEYYEWALRLPSDSYKKTYSDTSLEEHLANHYGLVYVHEEGFTVDDSRLTTFLSGDATGRCTHLVSVIGRHVVNKEGRDINPALAQKLCALWDRLLQSDTLGSEVYAEFGWWIKKNNNFVSTEKLRDYVEKTLVKSGGSISWEYNLEEILPELCGGNPTEQKYNILQLYFTAMSQDTKRAWRNPPEVAVELLKNMYADADFRERVYTLVGELISNGGSRFWNLKKAFEGGKKLT